MTFRLHLKLVFFLSFSFSSIYIFNFGFSYKKVFIITTLLSQFTFTLTIGLHFTKKINKIVQTQTFRPHLKLAFSLSFSSSIIHILNFGFSYKKMFIIITLLSQFTFTLTIGLHFTKKINKIVQTQTFRPHLKLAFSLSFSSSIIHIFNFSFSYKKMFIITILLSQLLLLLQQ